MPSYAMHCDKCGHDYETFKGMKADFAPCESCGAKYGKGLRQNLGKSRVVTHSYFNPTTFGQQCEHNAKRLGKEQCQLLEEKYSQPTAGFKGKLPKGAKIKPREAVSAELPWWRDGSVQGCERSEKPIDVTKIKDPQKYVETGSKE